MPKHYLQSYSSFLFLFQFLYSSSCFPSLLILELMKMKYLFLFSYNYRIRFRIFNLNEYLLFISYCAEGIIMSLIIFRLKLNKFFEESTGLSLFSFEEFLLVDCSIFGIFSNAFRSFSWLSWKILSRSVELLWSFFFFFLFLFQNPSTDMLK